MMIDQPQTALASNLNMQPPTNRPRIKTRDARSGSSDSINLVFKTPRKKRGKEAPSLYIVIEDEEYKGSSSKRSSGSSSLYDSANWTQEDREKYFEPATRTWTVKEEDTGNELTLRVRDKGFCVINECTGVKCKVAWQDFTGMERGLLPSALVIAEDDGELSEIDEADGVIVLYYKTANGGSASIRIRTNKVLKLEKAIKRYFNYSRGPSDGKANN